MHVNVITVAALTEVSDAWRALTLGNTGGCGYRGWGGEMGGIVF